MIEKILKPHTIVPKNLYVLRQADIKLREVVMNMGRPGYVLVARQMGKTNLLLNAKRELEDENNIFLYVDLSNTFPTIVGFFRNIVDIALEVFPQYFDGVRERIEKSRQSNHGLPAHKEHERELRLLLSSIKGKIVICLDEIDALTNSNYSDNVFSLVRSIYFSTRINFPDFQRLTYILSGVAEPNEIIKDKSISPFNIGEKIYLDDFTYSEYLNFIEMSGLRLDDAALERVFYWTNGNPRICWDIGSLLEDELIAGNVVNGAKVDEIVKKLYLTSFDMAPIDHIRRLVEDDSVIRSSVISIKKNNISNISDEQCSKLYLSGILSSSYLSGNISIKNRVVDRSLSIDWLEYVESKKLSIFERAQKKYQEKAYEEAITLFKEYVSSAVGEQNIELAYDSIGECYLMLRNYLESIKFFTRKPFTKDSHGLRNFEVQQRSLGVAYFYNNEIEKSIDCNLKITGDDYSNGYSVAYLLATLTLSAAYLSNFERYSEKVLILNSKIINDEKIIINLFPENPEVIDYVVSAHFNISKYYRALGHDLMTKNNLRLAIDKAAFRAKPAIIVSLLEITQLPEERHVLLTEILEVLTLNLIPISAEIGTDSYAFSQSLFAIIIKYAYSLQDNDLRERYLELLRSTYSDNSDCWNILVKAGVDLLSQKDMVGAKILRDALSLPISNNGHFDRKVVFCYIFYNEEISPSLEFEQQYIKDFLLKPDIDIDEYEFSVIYRLAFYYIDKYDIVGARKILSAARSKKYTIDFSGVKRELRGNDAANILLNYIEIQVLSLEGNMKGAKILAIESLKLNRNVPVLNSFPDDFNIAVGKELKRISLIRASGQVPLRVESRVGRNQQVTVRYKDGMVASGKFKIFEVDVYNKMCEIILN